MLETLPELVELRVSTVLENGKASLDVQHLVPPTPRQWSAAVGGHRLQLPMLYPNIPYPVSHYPTSLMPRG